jgi:hypothetical protein
MSGRDNAYRRDTMWSDHSGDNRVTVSSCPNSLEIALTGEIGTVIQLGHESEQGRKPRFSALNNALSAQVNVVAGIGFEPMTFRL